MNLKEIFKKKADASQAASGQPGSAEAQAALPTDRPIPSVNGRKKTNPLLKLIGWALVLGAVGGALYKVNTQKPADQVKQEKKEEEEKKKNSITGKLPVIGAPDRPAAPPMAVADNKKADDKADQTGDKATATPPAAAAAVVPPPAANTKPPLGNVQTAATAKAASPATASAPAKVEPPKKRSVYMTVANVDDTNVAGSGVELKGASTNANLGNSPNQANGNDELSKSLTPTRTKDATAYMLSDRNFLLAKGAFLDCSLDTKINSTVPGMTVCTLNREVRSDNGKVVLLEQGSKVTGQYQGSLKQGQARIFVLWTRITTPNGVAIDLDSPGTDALGASGLDGYIDTHFGERFGGAIMLSLIQDVGAAAAGGGNSNTYANTQAAGQNMASEALRNTINIPPTLVKNQGEHINIFVARDLSFRSVYALRND